jgi:curved DNA-binding protein CbpA
MNDPYAVLGVNQNATDEQIKVAYRDLVKKYHPDRYLDNPLSDLANEKMQEINKAYEQINNLRSGKQNAEQNTAYSQYNNRNNNGYNPNNNGYNPNNGYDNQRYYRNGNRGGGGCCDACTGLICADCLCECCGGDLISCC